MNTPKGAKNGHGFGTARFHKMLNIFEDLQGATATTGERPMETFDLNSCQHRTANNRCLSQIQCVRFSDTQPSKTRVYYYQTWLRELVCKRCRHSVPSPVSSYVMQIKSTRMSNRSVSSEVLAIRCPQEHCKAILLAYHSLFPTKSSSRKSEVEYDKSEIQ